MEMLSEIKVDMATEGGGGGGTHPPSGNTPY